MSTPPQAGDIYRIPPDESFRPRYPEWTMPVAAGSRSITWRTAYGTQYSAKYGIGLTGRDDAVDPFLPGDVVYIIKVEENKVDIETAFGIRAIRRGVDIAQLQRATTTDYGVEESEDFYESKSFTLSVAFFDCLYRRYITAQKDDKNGRPTLFPCDFKNMKEAGPCSAYGHYISNNQPPRTDVNMARFFREEGIWPTREQFYSWSEEAKAEFMPAGYSTTNEELTEILSKSDILFDRASPTMEEHVNLVESLRSLDVEGYYQMKYFLGKGRLPNRTIFDGWSYMVREIFLSALESETFSNKFKASWEYGGLFKDTKKTHNERFCRIGRDVRCAFSIVAGA